MMKRLFPIVSQYRKRTLRVRFMHGAHKVGRNQIKLSRSEVNSIGQYFNIFFSEVYLQFYQTSMIKHGCRKPGSTIGNHVSKIFGRKMSLISSSNKGFRACNSKKIKVAKISQIEHWVYTKL